MNIKTITNVVLTAVEIILSITVVFSFFLATPVNNPRFIEIPKGSLTTIITKLRNDGLDLDRVDLYLIRSMGVAQSGWIDFIEPNTTRADFYYQLTNAKAALNEIKLIPGETTVMVLDLIAEQLDLDKTALKEAYDSYAPLPEGVLIPESYKVPMGINETDLIRFLVDSSLKVHESRAINYLGRYEMKQWFAFVSRASIVEKEAANHMEMPIVASVIENRLAKNMRLQMDGSLNYGYYSRQRVTAQRIRTDTSPYNTYKYRGVPPQPVCLVGKEAIDAVFNPAKTDYLYFVKNRDGTHDFSTTYKTHLKNIRSE